MMGRMSQPPNDSPFLDRRTLLCANSASRASLLQSDKTLSGETKSETTLADRLVEHDEFDYWFGLAYFDRRDETTKARDAIAAFLLHADPLREYIREQMTLVECPRCEEGFIPPGELCRLCDGSALVPRYQAEGAEAFIAGLKERL